MAEIKMGTKAGIVIGGVAGSALAPALSTFVDAKAAAEAVKNGDMLYPEAYPLTKRTGILVPLISGIPTLLLGLFGDKLLADVVKDAEQREALQIGLLSYGSTATTGGVIELARAVEARKAVGVDLWNPDPKADTTAFAAQRSIAYYQVPLKPGAAGAITVKAAAPK